MLAGYGDFGALQRIGYVIADGSFQSAIFNNIPQTYQDLMIVARLRSTTSGSLDSWQVQANATASVYSHTPLKGDGSSATSVRGSSVYGIAVGTEPAAGATSGIYNAGIAHILNYTNSSNFKTVLGRSSSDLNGSGEVYLTAGLIRITNALTQIQVFTSSANMASGSTVELFGVKASNA